MPNPNEYVESYLEEFITRCDPGFAVLVSAPWGAGKTHLIKCLIDRCNDEKKPLYVSLFGVTCRDDIEMAILQAIAPYGNSKLGKILGKLGKKAISKTGLTLRDLNVIELLGDNAPQILVFDDLERTEMKISELLGYLNGFVEHEGKNLILLANEDELWRNEDRRIKEKLIGHTLTVRADVDAVLKTLLQALGDSGAKEYLKDQQDVVKRVFEQSASNNLRVLGQCLWDFERLFKVLDKEHRKNEAGMKELLGLFLALSIEFKTGGLGRMDFKQRDADEWNDSENEELKKLLVAKGKYSDENIRQGRYGSALSAGLAISLICDGWAKPDEINKSLLQSRHFARVKKEAEWETVLRAWSRTEEDVSKAVDRMEEKFSKRAYHDAGVVLLVFISRLRLPEMGFLEQPLDVVEKECCEYIDDLEKAGNLCGFDPAKDWREGYGYGDRQHLGYGWPSGDSPSDKAFLQLREYMKKAQDRVFEGSFPAICDELLVLMETDTDQFRIRLSANNTVDAIYRDHPVLKGMDVQAFVDKLLMLAPSSRNEILHTLKERYDSPSEKLREEGDWLKGVHQELIDRMSTLSNFQRWQLKRAVDVHLTNLVLEWDKGDAES